MVGNISIAIAKTLHRVAFSYPHSSSSSFAIRVGKSSPPPTDDVLAVAFGPNALQQCWVQNGWRDGRRGMGEGELHGWLFCQRRPAIVGSGDGGGKEVGKRAGGSVAVAR